MVVDPAALVGLAIVAFFMVLAVVLVVRGTAKKDKWGINVEGVVGTGRCPKCGTGLPAIRSPNSFRQAMWGGWTCSTCKAELDKWGRLIG